MSVSAILLDPTTPLKYLAEQARDRWAEVQSAEYEICVAMRRLFVANAHRGSGKSRFVDWAERKLGIPVKLAALFYFLGYGFDPYSHVGTGSDAGGKPGFSPPEG